METDDVLTLLKDVADEVINPRFRALASDEIAEKNPGDLVTVADRESEVRITEVLRREHPDALVLGEEAFATDAALLDRFRSADHAFTVDPVDGGGRAVAGRPRSRCPRDGDTGGGPGRVDQCRCLRGPRPAAEPDHRT